MQNIETPGENGLAIFNLGQIYVYQTSLDGDYDPRSFETNIAGQPRLRLELRNRQHIAVLPVKVSPDPNSGLKAHRDWVRQLGGRILEVSSISFRNDRHEIHLFVRAPDITELSIVLVCLNPLYREDNNTFVRSKY